MYGFYEISADGRKKCHAFNGAQFKTIADALDTVKHSVLIIELDKPNDAVDLFTDSGNVYSLERI